MLFPARILPVAPLATTVPRADDLHDRDETARPLFEDLIRESLRRSLHWEMRMVLPGLGCPRPLSRQGALKTAPLRREEMQARLL